MRLRVAASAAVTVLVAGALSGCMLITPQQTTRSYTPSDGVNGQVGDVQIRNVLLVSGEGAVANMVGVLSNTGNSPQTVTLQYDTTAGTESTQLTVPANGVLSLRPNPSTQVDTQVTTDAKAVRLTDVSVTPGALFPVGFGTGGSDPVSLRVPVLNGSLSQYSTLVPTPTASASEGSGDATATPGATDSPAATDTPSPSATLG